MAVLAPVSYGPVLVALRGAPPGMVATTRTLNVVAGTVVGIVLLRERPGRSVMLGTALIAAGAVIASG